MVRNYKRKLGARHYHDYAEEQLTKAAEECRKGMSIRAASKKYKVTRGTLHNRLRGLHEGKSGRPTVLTEEEESVVVQHLLTLSNWGFPLNFYDTRKMVHLYLEKCDRKVAEFSNNFPETDWLRGFLDRHKNEIGSRLCQNIKRNRAIVDSSMLEKYFENLAETLKDVPPENIINYDETNITDNPGKSKCIFKRGTKYPDRVMNHSKSAISLMFAGTATGHILPPYVVYKAENLWNTWTMGGPTGTRYNRTKSGWFDAACFEDWFEHIVLPYYKKLKGIKVLIGDNLASHISYDVIDKCQKNDIKFVCLPPNSTHLCQPLDVAYYRSLKQHWRKILLQWKSGPGKRHITLPKDAFPVLLKELVDSMEDVTEQNLVSGFRTTGIYPLNKDEVLRKIPKTGELAETTNLVSNTVIEILSSCRYVSAEPARKKRKSRMDVDPGKGITPDSFEDDGPSTSTPKRSFNQKIATVTSNDAFNEISDSDDHENEVCSPQDGPLKQREWLLVSLSSSKSTEYYVGQIVSLLSGEPEDGDYLVTFLKRKSGTQEFVWPPIKDVAAIDANQVVARLNPPADVVRGNLARQQGSLYFSENLDLYWSKLH